VGCPAALNIAGLVITMAGVLLLFRYGMPYRVRTDGQSALILTPEQGRQGTAPCPPSISNFGSIIFVAAVRRTTWIDAVVVVVEDTGPGLLCVARVGGGTGGCRCPD
jgi:hypothetical protein